MKRLKKIFLFEPSIGSDNLGDGVIVESIKREMHKLFSTAFCIELPTHTPISNRYMYFLKKADHKFICGSNILVSTFFSFIHLKQWMVNIFTLSQIKGAVFIGVGAQKRIKNYGFATKIIYRYLFNNNILNSVRDSYTEELLHRIGISNVINTGCPTMWRFSDSFCNMIPTRKAPNVVFTVTDYKPNEKRDRYLINVLLSNYSNVYFWPQGVRDYDYFMSLNIRNGIKVIDPSLRSYEEFLDNHDTDFVGTRLHGGIYALQKKKRTIIIGVDNRANELKKDFNIPVICQENIELLEETINSEYRTSIKLPVENIRIFLKQFNIEY